MRGLRLLTFSLLLWTGQAAAREGDSWRGEARLEANSVGDANGGVFAPSPRLTGAWYFQPLRDDGTQPLAVLGFLQHPDEVDLSVSAGTWAAGLGGTLFPWKNTGLTVSLSSTLGTPPRSVVTQYSAGLIQYLSPNLRLELQYLGSQSQTSIVTALSNFEVFTSAIDRGHLGGSWLVGEVWMVSVAVDYGVSRGQTAQAALTGPSVTIGMGSTWGWIAQGSAAVTGFIGHRLSLTLGFNASKSYVNVIQGDEPARETYFFSVAPSAQYFFLDNLFARLGLGITSSSTILFLPEPQALSLWSASASVMVGARF